MPSHPCAFGSWTSTSTAHRFLCTHSTQRYVATSISVSGSVNKAGWLPPPRRLRSQRLYDPREHAQQIARNAGRADGPWADDGLCSSISHADGRPTLIELHYLAIHKVGVPVSCRLLPAFRLPGHPPSSLRFARRGPIMSHLNPPVLLVWTVLTVLVRCQ